MNKYKLKFNKFFWFLKKRGNGLDLQKDQNLIIHQTLALGSMEDVQNLFHEYGKETIKREFEKPVRGIYAPSVLHFFEYVLGSKVKNSEQYIKNIYGKTLPRNS